MQLQTIKSLCLILLIFYSLMGFAQDSPSELNKKEVNEFIQSLNQLLNENYVYPEHAKKMSALLTKNNKKGKYRKIKDVWQFSETIQNDLRSVFNDKHLSINYSPDDVAWLREQANNPNDETADEALLKTRRQFNFGFDTVQILRGNIGYIKLDGFSDTDHASETAIAAMTFLSHADALIFDLRKNGGGSPKMIQLISSYLFDQEPVHLSGFYWRPTDTYTQNWTLPYVPGKRSPDTDLYILTSSDTFSAAEEFSYNLKHLKRATLIGETTGGGAHPGGPQAINDRFTVWLPTGRSTNPVTQTNWEGTGVVPHIETPAKNALGVAKSKALEKLSEKHPGESGHLYRWYLVSEKAALNPIEINPNTLHSYTGTYGPRTLLVENEQLFYQREGGAKLLLKALDQDLFELVENNSFRMKIIKKDGVVTGLQGLYDNGFSDQHTKEFE